MNPAEQPQVHKITPECQPVFPCWLWNVDQCSKDGPFWFKCKSSGGFYMTYAHYSTTHWHPDQPSAPTVRPDETAIFETMEEAMAFHKELHTPHPHSPVSKGESVPSKLRLEIIENIPLGLSPLVAAEMIDRLEALFLHHAPCPSLPSDGAVPEQGAEEAHLADVRKYATEVQQLGEVLIGPGCCAPFSEILQAAKDIREWQREADMEALKRAGNPFSASSPHKSPKIRELARDFAHDIAADAHQLSGADYDKALGLWEMACKAWVLRIASALATSSASPQRYVIEEIRDAWEAGFKLCRTYGDNWIHFTGKQREEQWEKFCAARRHLVRPATEKQEGAL